MHDEPLFVLGISPEDWAQTPETVRLALLSMFDIMQAQGQQLREFQQVIRDLQAKVGQTSRNSSKPPSLSGVGFLGRDEPGVKDY